KPLSPGRHRLFALGLRRCHAAAGVCQQVVRHLLAPSVDWCVSCPRHPSGRTYTAPGGHCERLSGRLCGALVQMRLERLQHPFPAVSMRIARFQGLEAGVLEDHGRLLPLAAKVDRHDARVAELAIFLFPLPAVDKSSGTAYLAVLASSSEFFAALGIFHRDAVAAPDAQIDLGDGRDPRGIRLPPASQNLGIGPRVEHVLGGGVVCALQAQARLVRLCHLGHFDSFAGLFSCRGAPCCGARCSFCSRRYRSTVSSFRSHSSRWFVIHAYASSSGCSRSRRRCMRPSITRVIAPASSSSFRCLLIAGLDTPKSPVASPTVSSPPARRSRMPLLMGCEQATKVRSSRALL